jgi:hypothetical protein
LNATPVAAIGEPQEIADEQGLDARRTSILFPPVVPPQRFAIDPENRADLSLRMAAPASNSTIRRLISVGSWAGRPPSGAIFP